MMDPAHYSVLLKESLAGLAIKPDGIYVDATFGRGGHSSAILAELGPQGRLFAVDRDPQAIVAAEKFAGDTRFRIFHAAFADMQSCLAEALDIHHVDGVLMDLGVSSPQLDQAERGFSFLRDGPLDMRMDTTKGQSAAQWLTYADEQDIAQVIKEFRQAHRARDCEHAQRDAPYEYVAISTNYQ